MLFKSEYYLWDPYVKYRDFILSCIDKGISQPLLFKKHEVIKLNKK